MTQCHDFSEVKCYYTGGGVWVYSARCDDVYVYGALDQYMGTYAISGEDIEENHNSDYDAFEKQPDRGIPTWHDILLSLVTYLHDDPCLADMVDALTQYNQDLAAPICS